MDLYLCAVGMTHVARRACVAKKCATSYAYLEPNVRMRVTTDEIDLLYLCGHDHAHAFDHFCSVYGPQHAHAFDLLIS